MLKIPSFIALALSTITALAAPSCAVDLQTGEAAQESSACTINRGWHSCGTPGEPVSNTVCIFSCDSETHCGDCQWIGGFGWIGEDSTPLSCPQLGPPPAGTGTHRAYCQALAQ